MTCCITCPVLQHLTFLHRTKTFLGNDVEKPNTSDMPLPQKMENYLL